MRTWALLFVVLSVGGALAADGALAQTRQQVERTSPPAAQKRAEPSAKKPRQPYEGVWGGDGSAACRDPDGVDRMEINGNRFYWYETRCRAQSVKADGPRSWTMRVSCEGEGRRYRARPRISLAAPDRLIMDGSPVGPTKRQVYVRCVGL